MVLGATTCGVIVRTRNSISVTPMWHFSIVSLSPAFLMHSKTARMFRINCVTVLAAVPMSSTYCAHWSALITLSKYFRMKLDKADRALLNPWAMRFYANVLLAKLKANISIDLLSAICRQWYAWEQSNSQKIFFPARCCAASERVLTGWLLLM